jgi:hypothetical protein
MEYIAGAKKTSTRTEKLAPRFQQPRDFNLTHYKELCFSFSLGQLGEEEVWRGGLGS